MIGEQWTIVNEGGGTAVSFTSFIDIDVRNEGVALSYPVEEGGFMNYNKVQSPLDIRVVLSKQGTDADFEAMLDKLDEYQKGAIKLFVSTPSAYYGPVTLEAYSNKRTRESGAGQLTVELNFVEVREVQTRVSTTVVTRPRNATSADRTNTGRTQGENNTSVLGSIFK